MFLLLILGCILLLLAHVSGAAIYRWGWRDRDRHPVDKSPETGKPSARWGPWSFRNNAKNNNEIRVE